MKELEQDILKKVKNFDKDAFHQLFSNFYDTLFRFVVYKIKDSDLAKYFTGNLFKSLEKESSSGAAKIFLFTYCAYIYKLMLGITPSINLKASF